MMLLLSLSISGNHLIKKYRLRYLNESVLAMLIGLLAGLVLSLINNDKYISNITNGYAKFFLIILLPFIIFESAYNLKTKEFFNNLGTILIYSILGTLLSIFFISLMIFGSSRFKVFGTFDLKESLAFGSLISSTDPVCILSAFKDYSTDPNFYQILFGESILNDAVTVVFYETIINFNTENYVVSLLTSFLNFTYVLLGSIILGFTIGFLTALVINS